MMFSTGYPSAQITNLNTGEKWSAEILASEIRCRAAALVNHGVKSDQRVMICHDGGGAFFADLFAIWSIGACAICTNPASTPSELRNLISFAKPSLLITANSRQIDDLTCLHVQSETLGAFDGTDYVLPLSESNLDSDALILFTSGTTGTPKGVVHSFRSLLARVALNQAYIGTGDLQNTLCVLPTHFGHGLIGNCLTPLFAGQHLILANENVGRVAARFGQILDDHQITFVSSVPSFWKLVVKMSPPPQSQSLHRVHVGSAPLFAQQWSQIVDWAQTDRVFNMYGITETANWISAALPDVENYESGDIGYGWGCKVAVKTPDGCVETKGEGELLIQSPALMTRYLQRQELTDQVLKGGWFHTGDIGQIREDGRIFLVGRHKYEINKGGMKVMPEEIDELLERHDSIEEACTFSVPDELAGEMIGVAVTGVSSLDLNISDLKTWCRKYIVSDKVPDHWFQVDVIPKNERGKINRADVAAYCLELKSNKD